MAYYPRNEVTPGVGESPKRPDPEHVARVERGVGGGVLIVCTTLFILGTLALTFGLAPAALVIFACVPVAILGGWLRNRGAYRLRQFRERRQA